MLARLWTNGIPRVRMMCTTNTWVAKDSMNQPVWNKGSEAEKRLKRKVRVKKMDNYDWTHVKP